MAILWSLSILTARLWQSCMLSAQPAIGGSPPLLNPLIDYSRQPRLWAHSFSHQSALVVSASALQQCPSLMATLIRATTSFAEKMTICVLLRVKIAVWCWI